MHISGKVALVTGGSSGIGKAIAKVLIEKQAKAVFILGTNEANLKLTKQDIDLEFGEGKVHTCKCDVTSKDEMEECFKNVISRYGDLHIVCNNAGICDEINWEKTLAVNMTGVIIGSKLAVQYMKGEEAGGGVIINTASVGGLALFPGLPVYSASKYGVIGYTRQMATFNAAVLKKKIRVNVICPYGVATPGHNNAIWEEEYQKHMETKKEKVSQLLMTPYDFARQHFLKLIEEPHHGVTMYSDRGESGMVDDETVAFREKVNLTEPLNQLRDSVLAVCIQPSGTSNN